MSHPFLGGRSQKRQPPSVITGFQIFALRRFVIFFRPDLTGDLRGSRSAWPRALRESTCGIRSAGVIADASCSLAYSLRPPPFDNRF